MSAAVATFGRVPQTCRTCTRPDAVELRAAWGCDGPTEQALFTVECPACYGLTHDCARCGGSGEEPVRRCPFATMDHVTARVLEYAALSETGILPVAGGWEDQSETFTRALRIALNTRAKIEKTAQEKASARG